VRSQPDEALLVRAVERAEDLGMIAGVRMRGSDLQQITVVRDLALAGVDYILVPYASSEAAIHDELYGLGDHDAAEQAIATIHEYEVAPVGKVPLVASTVEGLSHTLDKLQALDVSNVTFFALAVAGDTPPDQRGGALPASALRQVADLIEETASTRPVRYMWQTPVLRDPERPLSEQVQQGPRCMEDISIRVLPDGTVVPPRGPHRSAGNLLHDNWDTIWQHEAFRTYRERVAAPTRCAVCPGLALCAVDCPAEPAGWTSGDAPVASFE
jgi:radical SAM protein with 4Fe4S-binding SPASM domain